jgi:hypothetical protein
LAFQDSQCTGIIDRGPEAEILTVDFSHAGLMQCIQRDRPPTQRQSLLECWRIFKVGEV